MPKSEKQARRDELMKLRNQIRADRREAFDTRNLAAAKQQEGRSLQDQSERRQRLIEDRNRRRREFDQRNTEAGAREVEREPRYFTNKELPPPENKELPPPASKAEPGDLVGVRFHTQEARELAGQLYLTREDFYRRRGKAKGAFTVEDVERIAAARPELPPLPPELQS